MTHTKIITVYLSKDMSVFPFESAVTEAHVLVVDTEVVADTLMTVAQGTGASDELWWEISHCFVLLSMVRP